MAKKTMKLSIVKIPIKLKQEFKERCAALDIPMYQMFIICMKFITTNKKAAWDIIKCYKEKNDKKN